MTDLDPRIAALNERRLDLLVRKYTTGGSQPLIVEEKLELAELQEIIAREIPSVTCAEWYALAEVRLAAIERRLERLEKEPAK